jgi:hypothetical protein
MKYLKTFESKVVNPDSVKGLYDFLEDYSKREGYYNDDSRQRARVYHIPEIFYDEFSLLYRLYDFLNNFSLRSKSEKDYIKKEIKKKALISIKEKFEKDTENFFALKKVFDDRPKWNDTCSVQGVNDAITKNIFYLFKSALKNPPKFVVDIENI